MPQISLRNIFIAHFEENIYTLKSELNPICHLLELLGAHHILHVSRIRVKERVKCSKEERSLTRLVSYSVTSAFCNSSCVKEGLSVRSEGKTRKKT